MPRRATICSHTVYRSSATAIPRVSIFTRRSSTAFSRFYSAASSGSIGLGAPTAAASISRSTRRAIRARSATTGASSAIRAIASSVDPTTFKIERGANAGPRNGGEAVPNRVNP